MPTQRLCRTCLTRVPDDEPMVRAHVTVVYGRTREHLREPVCLGCLRPDSAAAQSPDGRVRAHLVGWGALDADPQPCATCGLPILVAPDKRRQVVTCSDLCRARHYSTRARRVTPTAHVCSGCGETMTGRADRRFCSSACRQRAYRRRQQLVAHGISPQDAADVDAFGALDADQLDRVLAQARQDGDLSARHVADLAREVSGQS